MKSMTLKREEKKKTSVTRALATFREDTTKR